MTTANCPQCGAPVRFRYAGAVQTVCEYCHSILVRHDVTLDLVGKKAEVPADASPLQLGTEGAYRGRAFTVVGRIAYEYDLGGWNEWHIVFSDGTSGWLSDAQLEYAVTFSADHARVPPRGDLQRGDTFQHADVEYTVTTLTLARYSGVEGDLPFEYWDKNAVWFLDMRATDGRFATIDYSEDPPLLFTGEGVEFDDLKLRNLREFEGWNQ
jgi:hypothetical protein